MTEAKLRHYRLKNEGEARPTGVIGTPLGKPPVDLREKHTPPHQGVLAVYTNNKGERFGVDVYRIGRAWAYIRIIRTEKAVCSPADQNIERQVKPSAISAPQSGDLFWWQWPNRDHYDYDGKLEALRAEGQR